MGTHGKNNLSTRPFFFAEVFLFRVAVDGQSMPVLHIFFKDLAHGPFCLILPWSNLHEKSLDRDRGQIYPAWL